MERRKLLIVDDIKSNRAILANMLGDDYDTLEAENGQEAIDILNHRIKEISAVLLDLSMPIVDGYEFLKRVSKNAKLSQVPVIVVTGSDTSDSEENALALGAKDYITKPYRSAIVKQRIWNTINLRETAAAVNALRHDRLTGLYSRDAFFEEVSDMVASQVPEYYIMASFDINKFKVINDQYGTEKGDEVLKHIAHVFQKGFSAIGGICCRISADNFAVLYPASFQNSEELKNIRDDASDIGELSSPIIFSIGRYVIDDVNMVPSAMYDRATLAALYVKNRYDIHIAKYDESMISNLIHEQEIVNNMCVALKENQFEIWLQPQYNHQTGAMIGAEALARWRDPEKGLISPGIFIPVFERNGFIYELDKYVWDKACQFIRKEINEGRSPLPISVNISRYDVFHSDFIEVVTGLIKKYEISVDLLRLEITESAFVESTKHIVKAVKELIEFGFTLEIDDFGSGYSSLNTLKSVPAQVVKLDMRFFEDDDSERGGSIIESVVRMTKWLGMSVIAEGVEKKEQADYLGTIGCDYIQGYLYAKPMPEADYRELCKNAEKEEKMITLETVENLDNNSFWNPESMDTLIFNSYVGSACILEYHSGNIELLRATDKYIEMIGVVGITIDDARKINWLDYFDDNSKERFQTIFEESIRTKKEATSEFMLIDLPGCSHEVYLKCVMRVIASTGDRYLIYCIAENITAQRKAEKSERDLAKKLHVIMENVNCGITAVIANGEEVEYLVANDRYFELLGYTRSEYEKKIGKRAFETIYAKDRQHVFEITSSVVATGEPVTMEYRVVCRDGSTTWFRSNISLTTFDGIEEKVQLTTYVDISEQKQAEQKIKEASLQIKNMMDDIPGGFARFKVCNGKMGGAIFINKGISKLTGMSHEELTSLYGDNALLGVHPDDIEIVNEAVSKMINNGMAQSSRYRVKKADGGYVWLSIFGRATKDEQGKQYVNIYYMDATEQMKIEEQQRELLDNLPCGAGLYELDGKDLSVVYLNKQYWKLVNRKQTDHFEDNFMDYVYPDDEEMIARELSSALWEGRDVSCDIRILNGDSNDYRAFHLAASILQNDNGKYSIYATYIPISNEEMSIQEMIPIALSAVMKNQAEYMFVKNKNLRYVCCSQRVARLAGFSSEKEMLGKSDYELFDEDIADRFYAADMNILKSGQALIDNIDKLPSDNGGECFARTSKFPLKDSKGNIIGVYGIGRDITEMRTMESQFELLANSILGGIATYEYKNGKTSITYFNEGYCKIFGLTHNEYVLRSKEDVLSGIYEEDLPNVKMQIERLIKENVQIDCIYRAQLRNGELKWINLKGNVFERNNDKIVINTVIFDITQREKAMELLKISEEENRLAMSHSNRVVCRYDIATKTLHVSPSVNQKYEISEIVENVPEASIESGKVSADTAKTYAEFYEKIIRGEKDGKAIFQRKSYEGWRWLEAHFSTIFSGDGNPISAVISYEDITEQREKDITYRIWQESFKGRNPATYSLFRCNVDKITSNNAQDGSLLPIKFELGKFDFNKRATEYIDKCVFDEDKEKVLAFLTTDNLLANYYQGKHTISLDYKEQTGEDTFRWIRLTVNLVELSYSNEVESYMLFEDIDKEKRAELATQELAENDPLTGVMNRVTFAEKVNELIQTSKPNAFHALIMLDIDGFKQVNDVFGHATGDETLMAIANLLNSITRQGDLVGRLGGDEFLVFLADVPNNNIIENKVQQICALTRRSFSSKVEITGSVGIAVTPRDGTDFETLYKKVDAALYYVKETGKDNYFFYNKDMMEDEHQKSNRIKSNSILKKKHRILVVDDSRIDRAMIAQIFDNDFIVEKAKDGNSALIRLKHYGAVISAVLLDLSMPGLDGFSVLKRMQENLELRNIPVIVVSADEERETSLKAIRFGAVDFVTKPIDSEILKIRVKSAISKADNERLRAKNRLLEYKNNEVEKYKTVIERTGTVVIEHDWIKNSFIYDTNMNSHIAGRYDERGLWHILLSDFVADTMTVKKMQRLVLEISMDKSRNEISTFLQLKTPSNLLHWFRMSAYKASTDFDLSGKLYLCFVDLGKAQPTNNEIDMNKDEVEV